MQLLNCLPDIYNVVPYNHTPVSDRSEDSDTGHNEANKSCTTLSLYQVEEAIANTSAAMYWAGMLCSTKRHISASLIYICTELYLSSSIMVPPGTRREKPILQEHLSYVIVQSQMARVHVRVLCLHVYFVAHIA